MSNFAVLTGAAIGKAIASFGKQIATFKAREHQLAYSALNHVEMHNDPKYLNALYAATPANYRAGLRAWSAAFGRVSFDDKAESGPFVYAKGKTADMDGALAVAPADYVKAQKAETAEKAFDEVVELEKIIKRFAEKGATMRTLNSLKLALSQARLGLAPEAEKPAPIVNRAPKAPKAPKVPAQEMAAAA